MCSKTAYEDVFFHRVPISAPTDACRTSCSCRHHSWWPLTYTGARSRRSSSRRQTQETSFCAPRQPWSHQSLPAPTPTVCGEWASKWRRHPRGSPLFVQGPPRGAPVASACIWCESLWVCSVGRCRRTYSAEPLFVAMKEVCILGTSDRMYVCGDGGVVPTTYAREMNPSPSERGSSRCISN